MYLNITSIYLAPALKAMRQQCNYVYRAHATSSPPEIIIIPPPSSPRNKRREKIKLCETQTRKERERERNLFDLGLVRVYNRPGPVCNVADICIRQSTDDLFPSWWQLTITSLSLSLSKGTFAAAGSIAAVHLLCSLLSRVLLSLSLDIYFQALSWVEIYFKKFQHIHGNPFWPFFLVPSRKKETLQLNLQGRVKSEREWTLFEMRNPPLWL